MPVHPASSTWSYNVPRSMCYDKTNNLTNSYIYIFFFLNIFEVYKLSDQYRFEFSKREISPRNFLLGILSSQMILNSGYLKT